MLTAVFEFIPFVNCTYDKLNKCFVTDTFRIDNLLLSKTALPFLYLRLRLEVQYVIIEYNEFI